MTQARRGLQQLYAEVGDLLDRSIQFTSMREGGVDLVIQHLVRDTPSALARLFRSKGLAVLSGIYARRHSHRQPDATIVVAL